MKQFFHIGEREKFYKWELYFRFYTDSTKTGFMSVEKVKRMLLHHF